MIQTDKVTFYLTVLGIGCGTSTLLNILFGIWGLGAGIIVAIILLIIASFDNTTVPVNSKMVYINTWEQVLVGEVNTGFYWTYFFKYQLTDDKAIDATINEFSATVSTRTSNGITVGLSGILWAPVIDALKYKKFGLDDVEKRISKDWDNTLKGIVNTHKDTELDAMQNAALKKDSFKDDTIFKTLERCGLEFDPAKVVFELGDVDLPENIKEANSAEVVAERKALGIDLEEKEKTKNVDLILIKDLLSDASDPTTLRKLRITAIADLGFGAKDKYTRIEECDIAEEVLAQVIILLPNDKRKTVAKRRVAAELILNIRQGRTEDMNIRKAEDDNTAIMLQKK